MKFIRDETQLRHFLIGHFPPRFIVGRIKRGTNLEPLRGMGVGNEIHYRCATDEGPAPPVLGDEGKESVFNFIPLACTGRKVTDMDDHPKMVGALLKFQLPQARSVPVAPPAVRRDEEFSRVRVPPSAHLAPPSSDGGDGERRGVVGHADVHPPFIAGEIGPSIGNDFPQTRVHKVVNRHLDGGVLGPPFSSRILEIPNALFLFRVHRNHRLVPFLKGCHGGTDGAKLGLAVGVVTAFLGFPIRLQAIPLLVQQGADRSLAHTMLLPREVVR